MKTKPSEGSRVWYWDDFGVKVRGTVYCVDAAGIVNIKPDHYSVVVELHYTRLSGFIRKKPRKCEECAKHRQLFYVGSRDEVLQVHATRPYVDKTDIGPVWNYIHTMQIISTEEVKK